MMKKEKTLSVMTWATAGILLLVFAIHLLGILFPQTVLKMYNAPSTMMTVEPLIKVLLIVEQLKYLLIAALAVLSGLRKEFSFAWGVGTAIGTAVVYNLPGRLGSRWIISLIARIGGAETLSSYSTMNVFTSSFSLFTTLAVWLLVSCTAIEIYAAQKNKHLE